MPYVSYRDAAGRFASDVVGQALVDATRKAYNQSQELVPKPPHRSPSGYVRTGFLQRSGWWAVYTGLSFMAGMRADQNGEQVFFFTGARRGTTSAQIGYNARYAGHVHDGSPTTTARPFLSSVLPQQFEDFVRGARDAWITSSARLR